MIMIIVIMMSIIDTMLCYVPCHIYLYVNDGGVIGDGVGVCLGWVWVLCSYSLAMSMSILIFISISMAMTALALFIVTTVITVSIVTMPMGGVAVGLTHARDWD
jgi:hypothetical protein